VSTVSPGLTALAFFISSIAVVVIILIADQIVGSFRGKRDDRDKKDDAWSFHNRFRYIMRDDTWYPSLSLFQFVVWTSIIAFLYFGVCLTRIFGGVTGFPPTFPSNLLTLMGISVAVPVISSGISSTRKYGDNPFSPEEIVKKHPLSTMLEENNKPSLPRFQMFIWTWIGITIYLAVFIAIIIKPGTLQAVENLNLPNIDSTLVLLMGFSQGAYLGGKFVASQSSALEIKKILPSEAKEGEIISMFGNGFGDKQDTVLFKDMGAGEIRVDKMVSDGGSIIKWTDTRIDLKVPEGLQAGAVGISVFAEGSMTTFKPDKITKFVLQ
jgi:hypothetical protein